MHQKSQVSPGTLTTSVTVLYELPLIAVLSSKKIILMGTKYVPIRYLRGKMRNLGSPGNKCCKVVTGTHSDNAKIITLTIGIELNYGNSTSQILKVII